MKVIITGTTGMVGEGVLLECLGNPAVERVLAVGRRSCGHTHPKLSECLVPDFQDLTGVEAQLTAYDACFYCKGKVMWDRVKGKAENALSRLPFKAVYHFRPSLMKPTSGQKHIKRAYKPFLFVYPLMNLVFPGLTLTEVARAMIKCVSQGAPVHVLEAKDIGALAHS